MTERGLLSEFSKGIVSRNPVLVTIIGLCPSLAVTTRVINGLVLGLAVVLVLVGTELVVALVRDLLSPRLRTVSYLAIIAGLVTVVDLSLQAWMPSISSELGIFVPLVVANCIILDRARGFAALHGPVAATADALGMGTGFLLSMVIISMIRELLSLGTITLFPIGSFSGVVVVPGLVDHPVRLFGLPAGALLVAGYLCAVAAAFVRRLETIRAAAPDDPAKESAE